RRSWRLVLAGARALSRGQSRGGARELVPRHAQARVHRVDGDRHRRRDLSRSQLVELVRDEHGAAIVAELLEGAQHERAGLRLRELALGVALARRLLVARALAGLAAMARETPIVRGIVVHEREEPGPHRPLAIALRELAMDREEHLLNAV